MSLRPALASLLVLCAAVAAGCGGPSLDEWSKEADGVCSDVQKELQEVAQKGRTNDRAEIKRRQDAQLTAFGNGVERIKDLDKPGGEEGEKVERFTEAFDSLNKAYRPAVRKVQAAVASADRQRLTTTVAELRAELTPRVQDLNRAAQGLNVNRCLGGLASPG